MICLSLDQHQNHQRLLGGNRRGPRLALSSQRGLQNQSLAAAGPPQGGEQARDETELGQQAGDSGDRAVRRRSGDEDCCCPPLPCSCTPRCHGPSTFHPHRHLQPWVNLNEHRVAELSQATRSWEWGLNLAAWMLLHLRSFERECIFGALKINCFLLRPIPFKSSTKGGQWDAAGQIFCT